MRATATRRRTCGCADSQSGLSGPASPGDSPGRCFFPGHTDEQQVFLAFVLAGMSAGGLSLFSAVWWVYALFAAGVMLPFEVVLLTFGSRLFTELSFMIPIFSRSTFRSPTA